MINHIQYIDEQILLWINSSRADWLDTLMWYSSQTLTWIPLYVLLIIWLGHLSFRRPSQKWKELIISIIVIAIGIICSDQLCHWLKYLIERPRPSHRAGLEELLVYLRNYQGGHYGFPSSHAANTIFLATIISLIGHDRPLARWSIGGVWTYALLNCYSRMYLGVHYPTDIVVGGVIGGLIGWIGFRAYQRAMVHERTNKRVFSIFILLCIEVLSLQAKPRRGYQPSVADFTPAVVETHVDMPEIATPTKIEKVLIEVGKIADPDEIIDTSSAIADSILAYAHRYLGKPYKYGASGPHAFDCSGFTGFVYRHFGYALSHSSQAQAAQGTAVKRGNENLQPGDILVFGGRKNQIGHVGICIKVDASGDCTFIHAAHTGVIISRLSEPYYAQRYRFARRIL